jgi:hypothetical protein
MSSLIGYAIQMQNLPWDHTYAESRRWPCLVLLGAKLPGKPHLLWPG